MWIIVSELRRAGVTARRVVCQCHLGFLHRLLDPLHNGRVQHLEVTRRPADGAHRVTFQPRGDLGDLLRTVGCRSVLRNHQKAQLFFIRQGRQIC